jgi:hypothetical protein
MDCKKRKSKIRTSLRFIIIVAFALFLSLKYPTEVDAAEGSCGQVSMTVPSTVYLGGRFDLHVNFNLPEASMLADTYIIFDEGTPNEVSYNITEDPNTLGVVYVDDGPDNGGISFATWMSTQASPNTVLNNVTYNYDTHSFEYDPFIINIAVFELPLGMHTIKLEIKGESIKKACEAMGMLPPDDYLETAPHEIEILDPGTAPKFFTVIFDENIPIGTNNGVSWVPSQKIVFPGSQFSVYANYVPVGAPSDGNGTYIFKGWSDSPTGNVITKFTIYNSSGSDIISLRPGNVISRILYQPGATITINSNITLYAIWEPPAAPVAAAAPVVVDTPSTAAFNTIGIYLAPAGLSAIAMLALLKASKKESD